MNSSQSDSPNDLPKAVVRKNASFVASTVKLGTRMWIITALCLVAAIVITWRSRAEIGPTILVHFEQGHGIKPGDALRHLGIEVGRVEAVELGDDLQAVHVTVRLHKSAVEIAREGSRFWIVRPQVSLTRLSGLETIVGAKYLAVLPGPPDAPKAQEFVGVETPLLLSESGFEEIVIYFSQGYGLAAGDPVRYRGIVVGEVTDVRLDLELAKVAATVRLVDSASGLARAGTSFWVERPRLSVQEIRGLETLVSGRHISLHPGPPDADRQSQFQGLDMAPTGDMPEGGLEIVLYGPQLRGLQRGAPVLYRGVRVGHIVTVGLTTDATNVEARAYIHAGYRQLVRRNTIFWNESGIDFSFGVTGVEFASETLTNVATGGVALATPDPPGTQVTTGARFLLLAQPDDDVVEAQPRIPVGSQALPEGATLPQLVRASLMWREKTLGITRARERSGWILPLTGNRLLGGRNLLELPEKATDEQLTLALAGEQITIDRQALSSGNDEIVIIQSDKALKQETRTWPADRMRRPTEIEPLLLVREGATTIVPITANDLQTDKDGWLVDESVSMDDDWSGAVAVSTRDGFLIGIAHVTKGRVRIGWTGL